MVYLRPRLKTEQKCSENVNTNKIRQDNKNGTRHLYSKYTAGATRDHHHDNLWWTFSQDQIFATDIQNIQIFYNRMM